MKLKPMGDRIIVRPDGAKQMSVGGIFIPESYQERDIIGVVTDVGDDPAISVKVGDRVMYDKYGGTTIEVDGEKFLILSMADVIARVE